ncbi:MAG: hypothetical protein E6R03_04260 [Hyphomicrobiaceae bacterium]|nr:MAG: hypothetical protein E6R03_04260 [Hyphomicrobiaceae bacterium]
MNDITREIEYFNGKVRGMTAVPSNTPDTITVSTDKRLTRTSTESQVSLDALLTVALWYSESESGYIVLPGGLYWIIRITEAGIEPPKPASAEELWLRRWGLEFGRVLRRDGRIMQGWYNDGHFFEDREEAAVWLMGFVGIAGKKLADSQEAVRETYVRGESYAECAWKLIKFLSFRHPMIVDNLAVTFCTQTATFADYEYMKEWLEFRGDDTEDEMIGYLIGVIEDRIGTVGATVDGSVIEYLITEQ